MNEFVILAFIAKKQDSAKKDNKKDKKAKDEKPKKQEAKPKAEDLAGDEEDDLPLEPKTKDPFDALPKGFVKSFAIVLLPNEYCLELGLWTTLRGSTRTMTSISLFPTSGRSSTKRITRFGIASINTPKTCLWSSCLVI